MNPKQRISAVMNGDPVDRMPVHASYAQLYHMDHFDELTGLPRHHHKKWIHSDMDEFLDIFARMLEAAPFDIVQPPVLPAESRRRDVEYVERDGVPYLHDRRTDRFEPVQTKTRSGHGTDDYHANEVEKVFDRRHIDEQVKVMSSDRQIAEIGAYFLNMEACMKSFRNDLETIANRIGDRISLCVNLNPYDHIEKHSIEDLNRVMHDYAIAGRNARGLVTYAARPITMGTPLAKVRTFIEIGRSLPIPSKLPKEQET